ncbi:autophagy-related protein 13-domain-containing protein [Phycomyces blakesleeanus]
MLPHPSNHSRPAPTEAPTSLSKSSLQSSTSSLSPTPSILGTSASSASSHHRHHSQHCTHRQCAYHAPIAHHTQNDPTNIPPMQSRPPAIPTTSISSGTRNSKLEHIIQNFYTKTAQVIVQARLDLEQERFITERKAKAKRFNVVTEDVETLREELKHWRRLSVRNGEEEPPPMVLDIFLDTTDIRQDYSLVAVDENLQRNRVGLDSSHEHPDGVQRVLIETWVLALKHPPPDTPVDLPNLYKRSIIFFRSLHSLVRLLPGHKLCQRLKDNPSPGLSLKYRLSSSTSCQSNEISLDQPIMDGDSRNQTKAYDFSDIITPLGTLKLQLVYRKSCDFQLEHANESKNEPQAEIEENYFTPTMAKHRQEQDLFTDVQSGFGSEAQGRGRDGSTRPRSIARHPLEPRSDVSFSQRSSSPVTDPQSITPPRDRRSSLVMRNPLSLSPFGRESILARSGQQIPVDVMQPSTSTSRRVSASHISPFKSPSLSSSPQAELMYSSPRPNPSPSERTRRIEFSSSFEKYKDRSSPNRGDTGGMSMMRRWSRTSDHSSVHLDTAGDADLEEFMRFVGIKQDLKILQGQASSSSQMAESSTMSPMSETSDSLSTSAFGSGSIKALSHFRNLRETHNNLSESLSSSFVAPESTDRHEGAQPVVGASLGSSTSSSSRTYMPVVPSPLHAEQAPLSPVHIPRGQNTILTASNSNSSRQHRRYHSSHQYSADQTGSHGLRTSPEQHAFSSYPKDRHHVELRRLPTVGDDNRTSTRRRSTPPTNSPQYTSVRRRYSPDDLGISAEIHRNQSQTSLSDPRPRGSIVEGSGSRHGDRASLLDDDDSLMFKMSELECESSYSQSIEAPSPSDSDGIVLHRPLADTRNYSKRLTNVNIGQSVPGNSPGNNNSTSTPKLADETPAGINYSNEPDPTTDVTGRQSQEEPPKRDGFFISDW